MPFILYIVCKLDEDEQSRGSSLVRDCLADTHEALCENKHNMAIYLLQIDEANAQI